MALRDIVTKDFGWKLLSVLMAAGIWVTVKTISGGSLATPTVNPLAEWKMRTFTNLPVIVMSAAADPREFKVKPEAVAVTVRGSPEIVEAVVAKEIHATVDLTDIESARDLSKRVEVSGPPGVMFTHVTPSNVVVIVPPKKGK